MLELAIVLGCILLLRLAYVRANRIETLIWRPAAKETELRREVATEGAQIALLSPSLAFVRWAKAKRALNSLEKKLEKLKKRRAKRAEKVARRLWQCQVAASLVLAWWFWRVPMVVLESDAVFPLGYLVGLPHWSSGELSVVPWMVACHAVAFSWVK